MDHVARNRISELTLGITACLTSVAIWPGSDSFEVPKLWCAFVGILVTAIFVRKGAWKRLAMWDLKWPLATILGSFVVATITHGWTRSSLLGSDAVADGLIACTLGLALAAITRVVLCDNEGRIRCLRWWLVGCSSAALYALIQRLGLDPIPWGIHGDEGLSNLRFRVFGTLGNPSFLAMLLSMALSVGIWTTRDGKILYTCCTLLCALVLGLTMCRSGIVAGSIAIVFSAVTLRKMRAPLTPVVWVAGALVIGIAFSGLGAPESSVHRFALLESPAEGSAGVRIALAKTAARAIAVRPVFGWGNGGVPEALIRNGDDLLPLKQQLNPSTHNLLLDAVVQRGILGLFSVIWLGFAVIGASRKPDPTGLNTVLALAMVAYLVNAFFGFATVGPWLSVCLLIGLLSNSQTADR